MSVYQMPADAQYVPLESNFKYVKERTIEPLKGKTGWWKYHLTVCATDHSLGITEVILKSDMETIYQGVNKVIPKGDCSYYGAVMKARDGKSLGYKITQTHEAVDSILAYKQGKSGVSLNDVSRYRFILNIY
jgi:hypothetical protein